MSEHGGTGGVLSAAVARMTAVVYAEQTLDEVAQAVVDEAEDGSLS